MKTFFKNFLTGIVLALFFVLYLPNVFSQGYIDSRIDSLFLADEKISFNVKINNPTWGILEGRLFVEIIGPKSNVILFKDQLYLYPGDLYLKSLDDRLDKGDYKVKIEIKDTLFETVLDQKILEFKVISSCNVKDICSYERAYEKCDKCRPKPDPFDIFIPVFFGVITIGIIFVIYFETKRRRAWE